MTALPPHRECRQYWQRACELILAQADIMVALYAEA
jgi:hypothetical protein